MFLVSIFKGLGIIECYDLYYFGMFGMYGIKVVNLIV